MEIILTHSAWLLLWVNEYDHSFFLTIFYEMWNVIYLLYKAEKLSVCLLSVVTFWHADISVVSASIETGLAQNDTYVFWLQQVCSYKLSQIVIFPQ